MAKHVLAMSAKLRALIKMDFVRSVGVLAGGTALAQGLAILSLPLLTRLYSPAEFSILAVYASSLAILSVAACLRLELAIPLPEQESDSVNLLVLALTVSTIVALLVAVVVLVFPLKIVSMLGQPALEPYLWMLPVGIWLASLYSALQYWATRKKRFNAIARTRMTQAVGGAGTQLISGWLGIGAFGLVLGHLINSGAGVFGLGRQTRRDLAHKLSDIRVSELRRLLRDYQRFPKYSTPEALANNVGIQLPVLIIAALAAGPEAGYLMLATRVMTAPMALIGSSVAQVYLSRAPHELRQKGLDNFTLQVLSGLSRVGVGPLIFAGLVAPEAFALIFGKEWTRAGQLLSWMTPWFIFQFLASPISMVMHVTGEQRRMLILTLFGLVIRLGAILIAANFMRERLAEFYAISGAIFYIFCYWQFSRAAGIRATDALKVLRESTGIMVVWLVVGVAVKLILDWSAS